MSRPGRQAVCQRSGSLIAELEASLRALIGPEPSDALLRGLLQTHKNNVAAAANAFYDMSTANGSQQPERIAHFDFSPGRIGIATMDSENGVVVAELIPGSQADVAGVPLLSVLVGIDAISVTDLDRRAIDRIMMVHRRGDEPIRLQFRLPPGAEPPRPLAPPSLPTAATPPPAASQLLRRARSLSFGMARRRASAPPVPVPVAQATPVDTIVHATPFARDVHAVPRATAHHGAAHHGAAHHGAARHGATDTLN